MKIIALRHTHAILSAMLMGPAEASGAAPFTGFLPTDFPPDLPSAGFLFFFATRVSYRAPRPVRTTRNVSSTICASIARFR